MPSNGPGCAELQSFRVKDTDGMGDKQQKPVPRAAAAYGRQLKIQFLKGGDF